MKTKKHIAQDLRDFAERLERLASWVDGEAEDWWKASVDLSGIVSGLVLTCIDIGRLMGAEK